MEDNAEDDGEPENDAGVLWNVGSGQELRKLRVCLCVSVSVCVRVTVLLSSSFRAVAVLTVCVCVCVRARARVRLCGICCVSALCADAWN